MLFIPVTRHYPVSGSKNKNFAPLSLDNNEIVPPWASSMAFMGLQHGFDDTGANGFAKQLPVGKRCEADSRQRGFMKFCGADAFIVPAMVMGFAFMFLGIFA